LSGARAGIQKRRSIVTPRGRRVSVYQRSDKRENIDASDASLTPAIIDTPAGRPPTSGINAPPCRPVTPKPHRCRNPGRRRPGNNKSPAALFTSSLRDDRTDWDSPHSPGYIPTASSASPGNGRIREGGNSPRDLAPRPMPSNALRAVAGELVLGASVNLVEGAVSRSAA